MDAHRSIAFAISKYAPRQQSPFVDHHFYTTVSVIRTMEDLLGLAPMNNNDAFSSLMAPSFQGSGDQPAFQADYTNRDNGLIYEPMLRMPSARKYPARWTLPTPTRWTRKN